MPDADPLSPEQQQQLADAGTRAASILRATKVATFNGWTLGVFAALSLLFAFQSLTAFIMGPGLGWIAWNDSREGPGCARSMRPPRRSLARPNSRS